VTYGTALHRWAKSAITNEIVQKEIVIDLCNEEHEPVVTWLVHKCWVSGITDLPSHDANDNAVAIQHLQLEHEGWERKKRVTAASSRL